jgi:lysophospholipase L1-like esterase
MKKTIIPLSVFLLAFLAFILTAKSAVQGQCNACDTTNIVIYTDDSTKAMPWKVQIEAATGMEVHVFDFGGAPARSKQAVIHFHTNNNLAELQPKAVFFQIGCDGIADTDDRYDQLLFDYPVADVCTLTGKNARHKRMAVSKPDQDISMDNVGGCLYFMIRILRNVCRDARVFLLPPTTEGETADMTLCRQIEKMSDMLCVPFVTTIDELHGYGNVLNGVKPHLGKMLILGDSYCQQRRWINSLEKMSDVEVVNLGVTSASMRDHFTDREKYPYSSNPVQADCEGNHNTLACQILKLQRMISGVGLLKGERSLAGWTPDIILVEGGGNDFADSPEVEDQYWNHIRDDIRTSFAGSLAYLTKSLHATYPDAQIFIVVSAGLYYGHTDKPFEYMEKARQQRKAAQMLGFPTINWDKDCRLSFIFNNSAGTGDGSPQNPFRYNAVTDETIDLLHPNDYGAQFLAESAIYWISRFLGEV